MLKLRRLHYRLSERKGQTMTEYALVLAGVAAIAMAGYNGLGTSTNGAVIAASQLLGVSSGAGDGGAGAGGGTGTGSGGSGGGGGDHDGDGHHHYFFF
jgi:hypothetical protein